MRINKVLLMNVPSNMRQRYGKGFEKIGSLLHSFGILYLASAVEDETKVEILDTQLDNLNINETIKRCKEKKPDLIGMSCCTYEYERAVLLAEGLKKELDAVIVFGGPHSSILPKEVLKNKCVDVVIVGEGEVTFKDLIDALNGKKQLKEVEGIGFKEKNKIIVNNPRDFIENLDELKFPARHLVNMKRYRPSPNQYKNLPSMTMIASRGCPYDCSFCSSSEIWKRRYRQRSVDNVITEIKFLVEKYGVKDINFWDDLFGLNKEWVTDFCNRLINEKINISWNCEFRADIVDKEVLALMKKAGCWAIFYGIETMDQEILEAIRKRINVSQISNAIRLTKEAGIEVRANYILGLPKETPDKVKNMIKIICKDNPDYVKFNILTPYPGTRLYNEIKEGKYGVMTEDFNKLTGYFATFKPEGYKSLDEVKKMQKYAYRKFYFRPKYLLSKLARLNSFEDIKRYYNGLRAIASV